MDEELISVENSNNSAKRSKLDLDGVGNEEDTTMMTENSMSNTNDKGNLKKSFVPNQNVPLEEMNCGSESHKTSEMNDKKDDETNSSVELSEKDNKVDDKDNEKNNKINEQPSVKSETSQKDDTSAVASTSSQHQKEPKEQTKNNEEKSNDETVTGGDSGTQRPIKKRRNYRLRMISSSSSEESNNSDDGDNVAAGSVNENGTASNSSSRRRRQSAIALSSSSDSDENSESASDRGNNDSDSTSMSISYPGFDTMDYEDSNSDTSNVNESNTVEEILQPPKKPDYNWSNLYEIMYREQGLSGSGRHSMVGRNAYSFQNRFYSSRHVVEKMKLLHKLEKHQGCVNSLNFNRSGDLLVSGSDDLKIILWNWAANKMSHIFKSGHSANVFQTKFINLDSNINIISSGRDGQVRHATIVPEGGKVISKIVLKHDGAVHKITPTHNSSEILTAGEDGHVVHFDLRGSTIERLVTIKSSNKRKVPLYSIAHHPIDQEFCVCGRNNYVYVYDRRNTKEPAQLLFPKHLQEERPFVSHVTCAVYNSTGTEIIASYSDEDIYLFNNKCNIPGSFQHRYRGHINQKTIKGVNFFGLNSEYIVSGSDCGNFFFWDKETESIVNWIRGDRTGVVNYLEPHPRFPVLATSGLDADVKIWVPLKDQYPPPMEGLEKCVRRNLKRSSIHDHDLFDDRTLFFFVHQCLRNRRANQAGENRRSAEAQENCPYVEDLVSNSSTDDDDAAYTSDENMQIESLPCTPQ